MCTAIPLASRVLPLALGTLLHKFDWFWAMDLNKPMEMDMRERMRITLRKVVPLKAIPIPKPLDVYILYAIMHQHK
ncbi:putative cytochrome P450 superfamily [Helianthus anomalus]